ncbi:hypothetical protein ACFE33_10395 [Falsihalocynthiibacter sp. SS001]|uniref:hypothetical protein n=1 Tax=Falsihalocynthiibacter sp. SS001 TaxID=3349698 RepID=UPI0036D3FFF6
MNTFSSRLGKTVLNLLLAMLNATLILIAVCLFLELRVLQKIDGLTATFAQNLIQVEPLKDSVDGLTDQVANLQAELAAFREAPLELGAERSERLAAISAQVDTLNTRISGIRAQVGEVLQDPKMLVDYTIEKGVQELVTGAADLAGCVMPTSSEI